MKLGTRSNVVTSPLTRPMNGPDPSMITSPDTLRLVSSPMKLPAITTCAAITAPIERSNSPETIT